MRANVIEEKLIKGMQTGGKVTRKKAKEWIGRECDRKEDDRGKRQQP